MKQPFLLSVIGFSYDLKLAAHVPVIFRVKNVFLFLTVFCCSTFLYGEAGVFEGGVTVGGVTYYETGNTFDGKTFPVTVGSSLNMSFAYLKTFKNSGWDVCSARMNYAVYPVSGSPSFTAVDLPFGSNLGGGGDQQWEQNISPLVNLASGLSVGNYKIAVYYDATVGSSSGCPSPETRFLSNSGANYIANLTVNPPLSATLLSFSTEKLNNNIALNWATATEVNYDYFQVEHHGVDPNWSVLGQVAAKGSITHDQVYQFIHRNPAKGLHYYRLKQVDLDGKFAYSPIISLDLQSNTQIILSPNPLRGDQLSIKLPDTETAHQLRLFNLQGQLLKSRSVEAGADLWQNLEVNGVPSGILFLQMDGAVPLQLIKF